MQREFRQRLPGSVQRLVDELEERADLEIPVCIDTRPVSPTEPNPERAAAAINHDGATIFIRSDSAFSPHGILHELLHIHRYWIEEVPQLMPAQGDRDTDDRWRITSQIENALEHVIIVPREAAYGFDPYPYWAETARKNWSSYPWEHIPDPWARRAACIVGSLSVRFLVKDPAVQDLAERCIAEEGLLHEAQRFHRKIAKVIGSKPRAVSAVLRFLQIPFEEVGLVGFDVRNRKRYLAPLPRH